VLCTLPAFLLSQDQTLLDVFEKIRKTNASMKEYSVHTTNHKWSASFPYHHAACFTLDDA
jgi:hypothetical protein